MTREVDDDDMQIDQQIVDRYLSSDSQHRDSMQSEAFAQRVVLLAWKEKEIRCRVEGYEAFDKFVLNLDWKSRREYEDLRSSAKLSEREEE
jgi:predicted N-acyltransferase